MPVDFEANRISKEINGVQKSIAAKKKVLRLLCQFTMAIGDPDNSYTKPLYVGERECG